MARETGVNIQSPQVLSNGSLNETADNSGRISTVWSEIAPKLLSLATISVAITAAGYFVITSYLATFTSLFTYNISPVQYVTAGINLLLGVTAIISVWVVVPAIGLAAAAAVVVAVPAYGVQKSRFLSRWWQTLRQWFSPLWTRLWPWIQRIWRVYDSIARVCLVLLIVLVALGYGATFYGQSWRMFGGGMPATVVLVFKEPQPQTGSLWPFPIQPTEPHRSIPVELLLELTDGVLVRDKTTNIPVIVKNDTLQALIESP
jgi:hypothetical protein